MEVATTPTFVDKQKEIKELSEKIGVLRSLKDTAERETKTVVDAADVAANRLKKIHLDIGEAEKTLDMALSETNVFIDECEKVIREAMAPMQGMLALHVKLMEKTEHADATLKEIDAKGLEIHLRTVKDLETLHVSMYDLSIYRGRIEEYYKKHFPDQKVIL